MLAFGGYAVRNGKSRTTKDLCIYRVAQSDIEVESAMKRGGPKTIWSKCYPVAPSDLFFVR